MFKKVTAFLLSAVIMAGASTAVYAESIPQTVTVEQEYGASAAKVWDGKTTMKAGQKYVLKKSVTISKKVTIPKGTTLTLNKGAKLTVGSKGTLEVKGKLVVKSGATLTVTGKMTTAKGSSVSDSGTIKLTKNKAAVTIGGTFTIAKSGKITGTPKSIKLGSAAKVTVKGTNSCKKLKNLLNKETSADTTEADRQEIEKMLNTFMNKALKGDMYGAFQEVYPKSYIEALDTMFAEYGYTFEQFINEYFTSMMKEAGVDVKTLAAAADAVKVKVTKLTDCLKDLTNDEKALLADCGDITKAYIADISVEVEGAAADLSQYITSGNTAQMKVGYAGGRWYGIG